MWMIACRPILKLFDTAFVSPDNATRSDILEAHLPSQNTSPSHLNDKPRIKVDILNATAGAARSVALGIAHNARAASDMVAACMRMPMHPQSRAAAFDQIRQVRTKRRIQRIAKILRRDRFQMRHVMGHHHRAIPLAQARSRHFRRKPGPRSNMPVARLFGP